MKVLMLNGSPHEKGCTYTALMEVAENLRKPESRRKSCMSAEIWFTAAWAAAPAPSWEDAFIAKTRSMRQWKR